MSRGGTKFRSRAAARFTIFILSPGGRRSSGRVPRSSRVRQPPVVSVLIILHQYGKIVQTDFRGRYPPHRRQELGTLDLTLVQEAHAEPRVRLLMTLPGVDYTVALALIAVL